MGMFNPINLIEENYSISTNVEIRSVEESYFLTSLEFCKSINEEFNETNKIFYRALLESNDDMEIITESFSDFFEKVKEIIKKFIEFIKNLFAKFNTALHSLVNSDKYLKKHEKDFNRFSDYYGFEMDLFNFTIDPDIPLAIAATKYTDKVAELETIISTDQNGLLAGIGNDNNKVLEKLKDKYNTMIQNVEDEYDEFRQQVIKASTPISAGEFANELFEIFRDGDSATFKTTVDTAMVNESLLRFKTYDKSLKIAKKNQTQMEKDYREVEKKLESAFKEVTESDANYITIDGGSKRLASTPEIKRQLEIIAKAEANKVSQYSSIHTLAFSAKLDAITDCYKQDKKLLYKALSQINKYEGKEKK